MPELCDIIALSNEYGANPDFVLAGGGNTSVKDRDCLAVKRSGTSLATIGEDGFVALSRKALDKIMSKTYEGEEAEVEAQVLADMMAARLPGEDGKRPSVEALLHGLFPQKLVVHLHPAIINGITCSKEGKKAALRVLGDEIVWMDEIKPGYTLAVAASKALKDYKKSTGRDCRILVLQNHGIFFAANTAVAMRRLINGTVRKVKAACAEKFVCKPAEFDRELAAELACEIRMLAAPGETCFVSFRTCGTVQGYLASKTAFAPISGAYTPDHIVYTGFAPLFVEKADQAGVEAAIAAYKEKNGVLPKVICVKGLGYFAVGSSKKNADVAAAVFADAVKIATYAKNFGGHRFMAPKMVDFIRHWEVESYRSKVSLAAGGARRLEGKIAVITGGAQGFGLGIATEMCAAGACVVLADMNGDGARAAAEDLCGKFGPGAASAVTCNVSDEESVKALCRETVLTYGGMDVFVSNAGIVRSGGLEEMDYKTFDLMTKVNYEAYFLCVKYASRVMKLQHKYAPERYFDVIQVNSKSGLTGSNRNFAYAGGKFGGIGLTQSFALELVGDHVKVNAICPGNFLGGPLWTDPVRGLFVQYLNAGKVPGAKTVDDVRAYYEGKVPMHRGCEIRDVARAIFYVIEQEYETGQAIPVTGGQNMLN